MNFIDYDNSIINTIKIEPIKINPSQIEMHRAQYSYY